MRRIDVLGIGLLVFLSGGLLYAVLRIGGLDGLEAGLWSQVIFVVGLLGWVFTYVFRVASGKMTYNQQLDDYETAVLQKRLDEMSPEELAALQQDLESDSQTPSGRS
ncbi:MAG: DUF3007 family protein [Thermosynechococcaceae cyanobacterium]